MTSISLNREMTPNIPLSLTKHWADVKTRRVWASAFASISFTEASASAVLAFTESLWFLAPAIPLLVLSGAFVWYYSTSIDYDNPAEIFKVREKAKNVPLLETINQHGWEKIFRHRILSPDPFEISYCSYAKTLDLPALVAVYEESEQGLRSAMQNAAFRIPEPKMEKDKFERETTSMSCSEILTSYPITPKKLYQYEIISKEAFSLFSEANEAISRFTRQQKDCEIEFEKRTRIQSSLREEVKSSTIYFFRERVGDFYPDPWQHVDPLQRDRIRKSALLIRDQACLLADQQFALATLPVRREIDAKIARFEAVKKEALEKINERYESFRRANSQ